MLKYSVLLIFISILLIPHSSLSKEFERGRITLNYQNLTTRSDSSFSKDTQFENEFLIDLLQDTVNFGTFKADFLLTNIDSKSKWEAGSYRIGVEDYKLSADFSGNLNLGDFEFTLRTRRKLFANFSITDIKSRGYKLELEGKGFYAQFFGGFLTKTKGNLGLAYDRLDQYLFGFKTSFKFPKKSMIGFAYVRTQNEKDALGNITNRNNNIFLVDGSLGFTDDVRILGEFMYSLYDNVNTGMTKDYVLIIGPQLDKSNVSIEANYKYLGKDFHYISNIYQVITNQQGGYFKVSARPLDILRFYANSDFYWRDPTANSATNRRVYRWLNNLGFTILPLDNFYVNVTSTVSKHFTTGSAVSPDDRFRYQLSLGTQYNFAQRVFQAYLRFRYYEDKFELDNIIRKEPDGIIGLRWNVKQTLDMQFEIEAREQWYTDNSSDTLEGMFRYYLHWRVGSRLTLNPSVVYRRSHDKVNDTGSTTLDLGLSGGYDFGKGFTVSMSATWNRTWANYSSSYLRIFTNISKTFRFGKPQPRLGKLKEDQQMLCGMIKAHVFVDENGDGLKQLWEKGVKGIAIRVDRRYRGDKATDARGETVVHNVLVGERQVSIDMGSLPVEYMSTRFKTTVDVKLRQTAEAFFPVQMAEPSSIEEIQ